MGYFINELLNVFKNLEKFILWFNLRYLVFFKNIMEKVDLLEKFLG